MPKKQEAGNTASVKMDPQLRTRAKTYASSRERSLASVLNEAVKLYLDANDKRRGA